jgi:chromosome segregation protein
MYLSNIEIIGFKSFAHRVDVKFDAGVTAIVGPNGCGKTNIVDAIRWALGEQRYSTLRSDKMEDVIFNGTKNRKPLGLAEVSLTIQNTKGILPTEYSEVTITRRVFRSGESEYLLNRVPCRLKDILDLFMDTGMGPDAYSVIELKMVETILSDKADERRRLFEEAAGVTKYKHRRKAAYRKLEAVQQDLTRVNDIVKEIQKSVSSLERQAKKAEQYNEVSTRLHALEIDMLEREYAHLHGKLSPLEERYIIATNDKQQIDAVLQAEEEELDQLRAGLQEIESQLQEAQRLEASSLDAVHRYQEKILIANERRNSLTTNIERYEKEKTDLFTQQEKLQQDAVTLQYRVEQLHRELEEVKTEYHRSKDEQEGISKRLESQKGQVQAFQDKVLELAHAIVDKRGEQERLKARIENSRGRVERANEEIALYRNDIAVNEDKVLKLSAEDRELRRRFVDDEAQYLEQEKSKKRLEDEVNQLFQHSFTLKSDISRRKEKIDFIKGLIEHHEGYSEGARFLLDQHTGKQKKFVSLAEVVNVDEKYRVAVETALADAANYLITETTEDALAGVEELKKQNKGKVTFISLQRVPKVHRINLPILGGGMVWATNVTKAKGPFRPIVEFLLESVLIVNSLSDAKKVVNEMAGVRCITLDGQVMTSTGIVRGGSVRTNEAGHLGKEAQLEAIHHEVDRLQNELSEVTKQLEVKTAEYEQFDISPYKNAVKSIEKEMTSVEMQIAQLEFEKKHAQEGIERNQQQIDFLKSEIHDLEHLHETAVHELSELEQQKIDIEAQTITASGHLDVIGYQFAEKTKTVNELEIKVVTLQGDVRNTERDLERNHATVQDIQVTIERRNQEITWAQEEIVKLDGEVETLTQELTSADQTYEHQKQAKQGIEQTYTDKRNNLHQIELKIKDERRLHETSVSTVHDLEMKISELKSNIEHLKLRANDEFEVDLPLKTYPDDEFVDFAQRREEIKQLKDKIRLLGAINFAAFDEFKSESERLMFLTQQRDDLIEAEKSLVAAIEEINNTAQRKFLETFTKIRENFIKTFKELFQSGDECDLRLEENVDPLEANIEILAQPRGKRPTSIDLLSGGEKTLTAIALLFAIYLVKPSPFCILDEVDAPLDDSNIDRYTRILKKFSDNTQFIVVTHNKRTMEAAQALYGVTMEEEGVSKLVTVRFNEEARVRSATVTGSL